MENFEYSHGWPHEPSPSRHHPCGEPAAAWCSPIGAAVLRARASSRKARRRQMCINTITVASILMALWMAWSVLRWAGWAW